MKYEVIFYIITRSVVSQKWMKNYEFDKYKKFFQ